MKQQPGCCQVDGQPHGGLGAGLGIPRIRSRLAFVWSAGSALVQADLNGLRDDQGSGCQVQNECLRPLSAEAVRYILEQTRGIKEIL